jgi:uncharacterized protein YbjQ (UPF0145 family)
MPKENIRIRGFLVIIISFCILIISSSVTAQVGGSVDNGGDGNTILVVLFIIPFLLFGGLMTLYGIIYSIAYTPIFIWGLVFSSSNLDDMIKQTVERETKTFTLLGKDPLSTLDGGYRDDVSSSGIVWAGAVYGPSHWHLLIGFLNNVLGGSIDIFQKVISAGRAESMQRLREQAIREGWDEVINVRIDTSALAPAASTGLRAVEVFAYGTGIKYD